MMEKFTKGPWDFRGSEYPDGSWDGDYEIIAGGKFIAAVSRSDVINETDFNVALIAAAPEMYKLLESIAVGMECFHGVDTDSIFKLLAKARGEQ